MNQLATASTCQLWQPFPAQGHPSQEARSPASKQSFWWSCDRCPPERRWTGRRIVGRRWMMSRLMTMVNDYDHDNWRTKTVNSWSFMVSCWIVVAVDDDWWSKHGSSHWCFSPMVEQSWVVSHCEQVMVHRRVMVVNQWLMMFHKKVGSFLSFRLPRVLRLAQCCFTIVDDTEATINTKNYTTQEVCSTIEIFV